MKYLVMVIMLFTGFTLAQQQYPLVTLQEINNVPDSLISTFPPSPLAGDTVRVQGVVMVKPIVSVEGNRKPIIWAGARWASYIQDPTNSVNGGLAIIQNDTIGAAQGTLLDLADTATVFEFTGVVSPYFQSTQLALITKPEPISIEPILQLPKRPEPIPLTLDSFQINGIYNYSLRKYQGMYVIFQADTDHKIITSNRSVGTGSTSGNFKISDENGRFAFVYAQSSYFKSNATGLIPNYQPPSDGSFLSYVRGVLTIRADAYYIVPLYPGDIGPSIISPPSISNVKRNPAIVGPNDDVTVSASIKSVAGIYPSYVTDVYLFKKINVGFLDSIKMTKLDTPDSLFSAVIPKVADSAFVEYYVKAYENNQLASTSPTNLATSRYSYFVLNRPLTIQDVRYSPFGSAYSGYNGYHVTLTGVVTADTSDIPGNHGSNPPRVYIQNGKGPWSAILLGTSGMNGTQVTNLKRGDNITVEGVISLGSLGVRIDSLSPLTVNSQNNPLPEPQDLLTETIGTLTLGKVDAEQWSGCLVRYQNVTIDVANADGTSNFGESYGNDGVLPHTRIIWSDGNTSFNAGASAVKVIAGDFFSSITGILGFTHAYYKLAPRKDADISGYVPTDVKDEVSASLDFSLRQNYPNPFNPSTSIAYSIPKSGLVNIKIYNILGQELRLLINQMMNPGTYNVSFDASSLTSGVYFYSLTVDNFTQVKKMMLLK
jgi:hypothetical protein